MRDFFQAVSRELESGGSVCLVSLLSASGSTPRGAGAMMAVFPSGASAGTIGGGNVEFEAQKLAAAALRDGRDLLRDYRFAQGDANSLGMVCGGDVTVQFHVLPAGDETARRAFQRLLQADRAGQNAWLLLRLEQGAVTSLQAFLETDPLNSSLSPLLRDQPVLTDDGWFSIPAVRAGWVHIFGGGHVSRALASALHPLGFRCAVYDDRAEYAHAAQFPTAARVALCDFNALSLPLAPEDYVVVMTRGHQADYEVLAQTLRAPLRYIGCIGSRKKLDICRRRLLDAGFSEAEYARLHAPIGLPIGAQTPEEIAVSVAAELIAVRAGAMT